ncbi:efflux RND transporter periplasmic adaptor subunit [uncultured Paracoccus sp.]|uniref:efflux RND transporter periplasmic adaptor subunit n=1 Tax=uncultured Paracoccus sp. TaxID=189685 RepID=UPI000C8A9B87|nr:efflux RND transporter periplasmic adaptor subunit [uncultured Paracoccus sp.]MAM41108.1 efflux transporter periplasmic adaptor subunit [Erythrobacter sp.]
MKLRKTLIAAAIALIAAGAIGWQILGESAPETAPVLARVTQGTVTETVLASGMLEAKQLVSVGARVSGQVETLAVSLGDTVKSGDLIAQIDSQDQQNDVLTAEASLANIKAQIAAKEADLHRSELVQTRQERLGQQNLSSQETVESAKADVLVNEAELQALKAQQSSAEVTLATARIALERTKVTAPIDGTVVAVVVKQGQTVNANTDAPTIVKLADLSTMLVKAEISEADVMNVEPGQTVSFTTLGAPDLPFTATVRDIEPAPSEIADSDTISSDSAVYYNGLLEVANPEGKLRIGMTAQVSIELARAENVLVVPASAIKKDAEGQYVEIWDRATHKTRRQAVEVGLNDKVTAEIRSGVAEGDSVVTGAAVAAGSGSSSGSGRMGPPPMF